MIDFIIVGSGQAGLLLSNQLLNKGYNIRLIGRSRPGEASLVSSGLINPVTGRRFVKTWNYENLIAEMLPFYKNLEERYSTKIVYQHELILQLESIEQENDWQNRLADPEYNLFCNLAVLDNENTYHHDSSKSYGSISNVYRIDVQKLIHAVGLELKSKNLWMEEEFIYSNMLINSDLIEYNGLTSSKIIFCEGVFVCNNPYFKYLPINKLKGERSLVPAKIHHSTILSAEYSIIPLNECYWIGSNYSLQDKTENVTIEEVNSQTSFIHKYLKHSGSEIQHGFGFRPASRDRRPILGPHPVYPNLYILNGLGTKASSLLPYCINRLERHFTHQEDIPADLSPKRFVKRGITFNS